MASEKFASMEDIFKALDDSKPNWAVELASQETLKEALGMAPNLQDAFLRQRAYWMVHTIASAVFIANKGA